jgi:protein ImuB
MTVPSYDDLTPGIPDVSETGREDQLALFLARASTRNAEPTRNLQPTPSLHLATPDAVFACLRSLDPPIGGSLETVLAIARDFSPRVTRASDCEVLLDVSGLGRLIGAPREIARQLARAIEEAKVTASVALASTQTMARLLAMSAPPGRPGVLEDLAGLPVRLLQPLETWPPAMNHRDRDRPYEIFAAWGIATLGDLAALPPGELSSRLGRRGVALHRLARGLDPSPFVPDAATPRYIGRLELEWPIDALEPLSFVFARLLDPLAVALERADRGAAAVHLDLRLTDRSTHTRLLQLPAAMRDPRVLRTLLLLDLESAPPSAAVDVVTIELDPAPARITQFSLLQRALPSPETLSTLTARLSALVGDARVGSPALLDSHAPDAFEMRRYAAEGAKGADGVRGAHGAGAQSADGAGARGAAVLRRCRGSLALCVSLANGRPVHVAGSRRGIPYGEIVQAAGPWRTSGGWWTDAAWNRSEWDVALRSGAVCRIVQDRITGRWVLDGVYD